MPDSYPKTENVQEVNINSKYEKKHVSTSSRSTYMISICAFFLVHSVNLFAPTNHSLPFCLNNVMLNCSGRNIAKIRNFEQLTCALFSKLFKNKWISLYIFIMWKYIKWHPSCLLFCILRDVLRCCDRNR
jgi:hypothetical protein